MVQTHINAFYMAVDEAKTEVATAQAKLDAAEVALKAHPDYVAPKKAVKKVVVKDKSEAPKKASKKIAVEVGDPEDGTPKKRDSKGHFVKS